jgi:hypothetical protein
MKLQNLNFIFCILILANVLFFIQWHNTDLLQNYSIMFNDINNHNCNNFYNIRDITEYNIFGENVFQEIYNKAKFLQLISIALFNFIIIYLLGDN